MKTRIATLALLIGLFISASAFALEPVPASKIISASIAELIESEMEYPEFAIEEKFQGYVVMELVIEEDGTFDVERANCVDEDMKNHVMNTVEAIETNEFAEYAGQTVRVKVNFDLTLY